MATTAVDPVFVDCQYPDYTQQMLSPFQAAATAKLYDLAAAGHALWTSRQTLRECLATMSRPSTLTAPVAMLTLISDMQIFQSQFVIAVDGVAVTTHLLSLLTSIACSGKQVHDANIVATMLAQDFPTGCKTTPRAKS
jgi:hypothetical protein